MKKLFLLAFLANLAMFLQAQTVLGVWKTIDDETGEEKSLVKLYEQDGKVYGVIEKLLRKNADQNRVCDKCTDYRKNQKILGMRIVRDLYLHDGHYQGGKILDPEKGKEYTCKLWLDPSNPNILIVRGYLGPIYRNQKWHRVQ